MHTLRFHHLSVKLAELRKLQWLSLKKTINYYHLLLFIGALGALQLAYFFGMSLQRDFNLERSILAVENRVSLDLPRLSLPNPALNLAGNPAQIHEYLQKLNSLLIQQNLAVRVSGLQQFDVQLEPASTTDFASEANHTHSFIERYLQLPGQIIRLKLSICQPTLWQSASVYPLLASVLLVFLLSPYLQRKPPKKVIGASAIKVRYVGLIIDLESKSIAVRDTDSKVELANKPLCFYAALLSYCQQNPTVRLCQHAVLPDELLKLANQYFMRLIALGHTIRKRPDFDVNMEKMLSEIRAALDELFIEHPESKSFFYPPKALGEGSRSKMHSFTLSRLAEVDWEIKGK